MIHIYKPPTYYELRKVCVAHSPVKDKYDMFIELHNRKKIMMRSNIYAIWYKYKEI